MPKACLKSCDKIGGQCLSEGLVSNGPAPPWPPQVSVPGIYGCRARRVNGSSSFTSEEPEEPHDRYSACQIQALQWRSEARIIVSSATFTPHAFVPTVVALTYLIALEIMTWIYRINRYEPHQLRIQTRVFPVRQRDASATGGIQRSSTANPKTSTSLMLLSRRLVMHKNSPTPLLSFIHSFRHVAVFSSLILTSMMRLPPMAFTLSTSVDPVSRFSMSSPPPMLFPLIRMLGTVFRPVILSRTA